MKNRIGAIIINALILVPTVFFSIVSPYDYEWDKSLRQVDSDAVLVLLLAWIIIGAVTIALTLFKIKGNLFIINNKNAKKASIIFGGIVCAYCAVNIIRLLLL